MDKTGKTTDQETLRDTIDRAGILPVSREGATGYLMIETIDINNFRCFEKASLKDCRRINIIIGENGSGKTALLESIFMSSGPNPEVTLRLRQWRGIESGALSGSLRTIEDAIWGDLFFKFNRQHTIVVAATGSREHNRSLRINYRVRERWAQIRQGSERIERNRPTPITFIWKGPDGKLVSIPIVLGPDNKFVFPMVIDLPVETAYFASNQTFSSSETAWRFSLLSKTGHDKEVVDLLKEYFPIENVSIEMSAGTPMVHAKVKTLAEKIPLSTVSGGLNRLAPILFSIPNQPKGVVLVDEIEDGFYYKKMGSIWQLLLKLAEIHDVQIFATTHSGECLEAAASVARENPEKFSLIRTAHDGERATLKQYSGSDFATTIEAGFDPRSD